MTDTFSPLLPEGRSRLRRLAEEEKRLEDAYNLAAARGPVPDALAIEFMQAGEALAAACSPTVVLSLLAERDALARLAAAAKGWALAQELEGSEPTADFARRIAFANDALRKTIYADAGDDDAPFCPRCLRPCGLDAAGVMLVCRRCHFPDRDPRSHPAGESAGGETR